MNKKEKVIEPQSIKLNMEFRAPKGTRDLLPEDKIAKNYVASELQKAFEIFGFNPIETPALEEYETATVKFAAGEGSDVMNEIFTLEDRAGRKLALRYEMTFPLARVIASNPQLPKPFKRYAMGPVWRNGPIKLGRYREFWQCDVDTVGIKNMYADVEILSLIDYIFKKFGINIIIKLNNRKLLNGIMEDLSIPKDLVDKVLITIDKLDKIGKEEVIKDLKEKELNEEISKKIINSFETKDLNEVKVKSNLGKEGIKELKEVIDLCSKLNLKNIIFDISLVRGLGYYTGTIFEVFAKDSSIKSSIAGGGRWDKMIQMYGQLKDEVPAVGVAFGLDVIIDVLKEKGVKFDKTVCNLYIIPIKTKEESMKILQKLRLESIKCDMDMNDRSISKNLEYANQLGIKYVLIVGKKELEENKFTLRNMETGIEEKLKIEEIIKRFKVEK